LDLQETTRSKKLQIYKKLLKNTEKIEKNLLKTLKKSSKTLKKPSKNSQKTINGNFYTPKFPYLKLENKLIHESAISRTTDFSPNTPIRLFFSGFIDLFI
jgi:vancomycin resistance protein YoaR